MEQHCSTITSAPLLVLLILGAIIVAPPKETSAFLLRGQRINNAHPDLDSQPTSLTNTASSTVPTRKTITFAREITKIYKSKSDDDENDSSSKRSWFKPWRWFIRKKRRKHQPKLSPTLQTVLLAYKEAKDLGIINVNGGSSSSSSNTVQVAGNMSQPYLDSTLIAEESIRAIVAAVPSDRPLIIENTFVGNTYMNSESNGLVICPAVKFRNDMSGAFHGNNNAVAKFGNVSRQNGVADFVGALRNNNNAVSQSGDVSRRNGVFDFNSDVCEEEEGDSMHDEKDDIDVEESLLKYVMSDEKKSSKSSSYQQQEVSTPSSAKSSNEMDDFEGNDSSPFASLFGECNTPYAYVKDKNLGTVSEDDLTSLVSASTNSTASWYGVFNQNSSNPPVIVRNTYVGNNYKKSTQNGLSLGVNVDFKNDMKETFYHNNNAVTNKGDIRRQNGVADFTDSLRRNNNAVSGSGNIERDNGADVSAVPLLLPLLDFNITLPNGTNSTVFNALTGSIFRLYKRKIQKKREQKATLKNAVSGRYKSKVDKKDDRQIFRDVY